MSPATTIPKMGRRGPDSQHQPADDPISPGSGPLAMQSLTVTAVATIRMRTSPLRGAGRSTSMTRSTSGGPQRVQTAAFIVMALSFLLATTAASSSAAAATERVRREVARVEAAPKDELPTRSRGSRRARACGTLAHFDARADRVGDAAAHDEPRAWNERTHPPRDHRRPQRIAEHVTRGRSKGRAVLVDEQPDGDRGQRECDVIQSDARHWHSLHRCSRAFAIAVIVFQLRVVTGTPKSRSILPR